jgi:hypothetical protein
MPAMLAAIYHNPQNTEVNWEQSQKILILYFWGGFETDTTNLLEGEMVTGPSAPDPLSTDMPSVL